MIGTRMLPGWPGIVEFITIGVVAILGIGVMVHAVNLKDVLRHLGSIVGVAIILIMLPGIMAGLWSAMTFWQKFGVVLLSAFLVLAGGWFRNATRKRRQP